MPNWCNNRTYVAGPADDITRFRNALELDNPMKPEFDGEPWISERLVALMPMPEALEGTTSPTPASPDPHPNWAEQLANGEISQEWHDNLCAGQIKRYEEGQRAIAETGYANWWDWQLEHWGVKWGDNDLVIEISDVTDDGRQELDLRYETPWGPFAESFWKHVSDQFPTLIFSTVYEEPGMCFAGALQFHNGQKTVDEYFQYGNELEELEPLDGDEDADGFDAYYNKVDEIRESVMDKAEAALWTAKVSS